MDSDKSDRPLAAAGLLPAFRVKHARRASANGVIRMKKEEYDELLREDPSAALNYIDESDGEVILVGSSLELEQRLQEPLHTAPRTIAGVPLDIYGAGKGPMHVFDISREEQVVARWRALDQRTTVVGQKAKSIFFGRQVPKHIEEPPAEPPATPKGAPRFGQLSPPHNSLTKSSPESNNSATHASRWAAYSQLPATFDHEPVEVSEVEPLSNQDVGMEEEPNFQTTERPSTPNIPSTPTRQEEQTLLDLFNEGQQRESSLGNAEHQPLLAMFEPKLDKLASPKLVNTSVQNPRAPDDKGARPVTDMPFLLSTTLPSLVEDIGQLSSAFELTNSELNHQIASAQQNFLRELGNALVKSLVTIDLLRQEAVGVGATTMEESNQRTASSYPVVRYLNPGTNTPAESRRITNTPFDNVTRASAVAPSNEYSRIADTDAESQTIRIDDAVENMRLALLDMGWLPSNRVYTRADILEDFLTQFRKLKNEVQRIEQYGFKSPLQRPLRIKDDEPYSIDISVLDGSANDPPATELPALSHPVTHHGQNPSERSPLSVLYSVLSEPRRCDFCDELFNFKDHYDYHLRMIHSQEHGSARDASTQPLDTLIPELSDETVRERYPSITQLESSARVAFPVASKAKADPAEPKTSMDAPTLWQTSALSHAYPHRISMPELRTEVPTHVTPKQRDDGHGQTKQVRVVGPGNTGPRQPEILRSNTDARSLRKQSSMPRALVRSHTIATSRAPTEIRTCQQRLIEMGFEPSRAQTVSEATMGNLEVAVDALAEDEGARLHAQNLALSQAWERLPARGNEAARRSVPGSFSAYDEELYG